MRHIMHPEFYKLIWIKYASFLMTIIWILTPIKPKY
nr:unnamed protein product [Callosobruchus chinensis]CAH7738438.1 unnamed protein product [Callosobruchus chinensis]CAH7760895.1 unnamed protein product [Callosobruchus chinensis]CAH7764877.1 unnamed protein product [Callosobruchus chinensis]